MPEPARKRRPAVEKPTATRDNLRKSLLSWYDINARVLPWRATEGQGDPYSVWLSEVMLQQTTVAAVIPYFERFLARWPDAAALAAAPREAVLEAWAGLGYYARARNLHKAAGLLADQGFPIDEAGWRALPGVGSYTAAAIAAIANNEPTNVVDGNVERVMARLHAVEGLLPGAKARLRALAGALVAADRSGDWAQALMDLGATVCTPKSPKCDACPWTQFCAAYAGGAPETYPRRAAKSARPERFGVAFRVERDGALWLIRRPEQGLLGGMAALPSTPWRDTSWTRAEAVKHAPAKARWVHVGDVRHVFTHFTLTLSVFAASASPEGEGWWDSAPGLPTVFKKAALL
jgi:A/G-specific adenine glycosylase